MHSQEYQALATYHRCIERLETGWPQFLQTRADRLRHGGETEKVAEAIVEDLLTGVLDWSKGDLDYQRGYADIVLGRNLVKFAVIEVKRPGTLWPGRRSVELALQQAREYASQQHIPRVAVSDGRFLYAGDIEHGGLRDRLLADLSSLTAPTSLWWVSVHGIYRPCEDVETILLEDRVEGFTEGPGPGSFEAKLHPKYQLPARCFAYVADANDPHTWKLPYRTADGRIDAKRLPKAIQALISNYRGAKVSGIPEQALPDVLVRLARAAAEAGRLPSPGESAPSAYGQLLLVLEQHGLIAALGGGRG